MRKFFSLALAIFSSLVPFLALQPVYAAATAIVGSPFYYEFRIDGTVNETNTLGISSSPYWWVNSGGQMILAGGRGKTIQGDAPLTNVWRNAYALSNPIDTDNGLHPQNIFRLLTRSQWQNAEEEIHFKINAYNQSASPNREGHNGVLLFNRYSNSQNLYYAGIRVDGTAVIKKKVNSTYYTLASAPVYAGTYDRATTPNLIPTNQWIGLRTRVKNNADASVTIELFMDKNNTNTWVLVATARDDGQSFGGAALTESGSGGLRTDFMDVEFDDYRMKNL